MSLKTPPLRLFLIRNLPPSRSLRCNASSIPSKCLFRNPIPRRTLIVPPPRSPARLATGGYSTVRQQKLEAEEAKKTKTKMKMAGAGIVACACMLWLTCMMGPPLKQDAIPLGPSGTGGERQIVVQRIGEDVDGKKIEEDTVPTGTSSVPTFPRVLGFRDSVGGDEWGGSDVGIPVNPQGTVEYQLVGLGIRTVSFLGIQVYVVGIYIATEDIALLQQAMIKKINPLASTLVAGEKTQLAKDLFDPMKSEEIWGKVLKDCGIRTIVRIVPTRTTNFHHLRDAFVRHVTARAQKEGWEDEEFGSAVGELKQIFNRGEVPKGMEVLMSRDKRGKLAIWYDDGKQGAQRLGEVKDQRISDAIWLNYLAGKNVASEGARKSIIDGVVEFVERPIGTVAAQVHI